MAVTTITYRRPPLSPPDNIPPDVPAGENAYDGFGRYGFRVPFAIVSPWARHQHVSHAVYDHTSILKLVETKWNPPALTYRDANALAPWTCSTCAGRPSRSRRRSPSRSRHRPERTGVQRDRTRHDPATWLGHRVRPERGAGRVLVSRWGWRSGVRSGGRVLARHSAHRRPGSKGHGRTSRTPLGGWCVALVMACSRVPSSRQRRTSTSRCPEPHPD
jgi:hypothetical protein